MTNPRSKSIPAPARNKVYERDNFSCQRCGKWVGACGEAGDRSIQHRIAKGRGGTDQINNLITLCGDGTRGCHGWVEANPEAAKGAGFDVATYVGGADAHLLLDKVLVIPLEESGMTPFLLTDDGQRVTV